VSDFAHDPAKRPYRALSEGVWKSAADGQYRSVVQVAMYHVWAGQDLADFESFLDHPDRPVGAVAKALELNDMGQRAETVQQFLEAVRLHPLRWRGQQGVHDLAVLEALAKLFVTNPSAVIAASVRRISEFANLNKSTAGTALVRLLKEETYVVLRAESHGTQARRVSLCLNASFHESGQYLTPPEGLTSVQIRVHDPASIGHDAISRRRVADENGEEHLVGLTKHDFRILVAIIGGAANPAEVIAAIGCSRSSVSNAQRRLRAAQVLSPAGPWVIDPSLTLDSLADLLGSSGRASEREAVHAAQRADFDDYRAGHPKGDSEKKFTDVPTERHNDEINDAIIKHSPCRTDEPFRDATAA
jgi:hypothetical protein